jgi:hypothetical protein
MRGHEYSEFRVEFSDVYVPWTTGLPDYEEESASVDDLTQLYWGELEVPGQPLRALESLREVIEGFRVKHAEELARAQQWHAAGGSGTVPITQAQDGPGFDYEWPVESWLSNYEDLYQVWTELAQTD